ncbi:dipeptidyl peptidase IV N-terminal region-domain-containing protein [Cokeromyces recurvatus]|uniref:dipeptidyl peptidase IV N-terminal region-domain-containing protein n=1 Tax=Cokeromyces recurvatus TaxID=90255 RepID=UPI00221F5381|nr:dipeptidyl peptidase IV N-terminal region-domain-containing protein [Cokeromyces recurvatus]KAI7907275.1 dipeptidyl peptidase IV N-terminal region-domain-containing protein [Cokeromyces recurvatus]
MGLRRDYFLDDDEELGNASQQQSLLTSTHNNEINEQSDNDSYLYSKEDFLDDYSFQKKGFNWIYVGFLSILAIAGILWSASIVKLFAELLFSEDQEIINGSKRIQFDDIFDSSFTVKKTNLVWVENDPRDGIYTYRDPNSNDILLESIEDKKSQIFVKAEDLKTKEGTLDVEAFTLSHDAEYLLLQTNITSQWRHSALFNAYIYHVSDKKIIPLLTNSTSKIAYAVWSPTNHLLAYVLNNDIYITDLKQHTRVTFDGSATVFNGVPDWVYEEEILASNFALWWAPDSSYLAFLRFDETNVPEYHMQMYTTALNHTAYPDEYNIRYPKAGSPNPLVSLHVYSLANDSIITVTEPTSSSVSHYINILQNGDRNFHGFKEEEDRLIVDVAWATSNNRSHLLFKQMNRIQDHELTAVVQIDHKHINNSTVKLIREYKPNDGGWIDVAQSMVYLPPTTKDQEIENILFRYLDILDNEAGFAHLAIVTVLNKNQMIEHQISWLTTGEWEVISGTVEVDVNRQVIHFISTKRSPYERHLYKISLNHHDPTSTITCITCPKDPEEHAYYSASFSPKSGYYILNYEGPDIPKTSVKKVDDPLFETVLEDNNDLRNILKDYNLPKMHMKTISNEGFEMACMEVVPADFDPHKKYPVLFHVYGGPGSQLVSYRFDLSWQTFVASQLGIIVVTVDGRGTGFRGRKYRVSVRGKLGELETIDQVNAGRYWAKLDYVDEYRMAIWGWSYGGYMTSKVIESNDGVFSTGMAVAPVTDWHFYDSVYTERYMKTPELNPEGYEHSAVNNMTGFRNAKYLLVHGTGDDNVHFQHTAVLIDKLTLEDIHSYRVQIYTDNNHAIKYHNANKNVYYLLTEFLTESFGGQEYRHIYNEMNGRFSGPLSEND